MTVTFQIDYKEDANLLDSLYTYVVCSQHYSEKEQDAIICDIFRYLREQNIETIFEEPMTNTIAVASSKLQKCYESILSNTDKLYAFIDIILN